MIRFSVGDAKVSADAQPLTLIFLVKVEAVDVFRPAHLRIPAADSFVATTAFFVGDADVQADRRQTLHGSYSFRADTEVYNGSAILRSRDLWK